MLRILCRTAKPCAHSRAQPQRGAVTLDAVQALADGCTPSLAVTALRWPHHPPIPNSVGLTLVAGSSLSISLSLDQQLSAVYLLTCALRSVFLPPLCYPFRSETCFSPSGYVKLEQNKYS